MGSSETFRFGSFRLVPAQRELLCDGVAVELGSRAFDLLLALVRRNGRLATKDELMAEVWPRTVVEENNLQAQVSVLRKALARDSGGQDYLLTVPGHGYRFVAGVTRESASSDAVAEQNPSRPAAPVADKPSLAVLPFQNMSGDPEQEYFADGIVDEIITALSRFGWLLVIARNSSSTYKGRAVDVKQVGRELAVRYVLEGSVRRSGNRVRITGQLIDTTTGAHLWADRFEGKLEDIFDLQDEVTVSVVGQIAPKLEKAEIERAKRKPTESLDAYDYFLRAKASLYRWTYESNSEALRLFYRAIALDPDFATAYGEAAWCYVHRKHWGWMTDRTRETAEASRLARRAVELDGNDAVALATGGIALTFVVGEHDEGAASIDRALALNPNLATTWLLSGWQRIYLGESDLALEHFSRMMRLSPFDPYTLFAHGGLAHAHFFVGHYEEALLWARKAIQGRPSWRAGLRILAAAAALSGRIEEAQQAMASSREIDPSACLSRIRKMRLFRRPEDLAKLEEGLRTAGLPE